MGTRSDVLGKGTPAIPVGALLILVGLASLVVRAVWWDRPGERSAGPRRPPAAPGGDEPDLNLDLESNPCLALIALGAVLLLVGLCAWLTTDPPADPA